MKKLILMMSSILLINMTYAKDDNNRDWELTDYTYGEWINIGPVYGCSDWKPSKSIMLKDEFFKQTSEKCKQDITRTVQERLKNKKTNEFKNREKLKYQNAVKITKSSREVKGVAECIYTPEKSKVGALPNNSINIKPRTPGLANENWQPAEPMYSDLKKSGAVYGCSNWTPDASTMLINETFNQTADDCKQKMIITAQLREQEATTLIYRNVGEPITVLSRIETVNSTRISEGAAICIYNQLLPNTAFWVIGEGVESIVRDNVTTSRTIENNEITQTKFIINGITYKRGIMRIDGSRNDYYELCN